MDLGRTYDVGRRSRLQHSRARPLRHYLYADELIASDFDIAFLKEASGTCFEQPPFAEIFGDSCDPVWSSTYSPLHEWPRDQGGLRVQASSAGAIRLDFPNGIQFAVAQLGTHSVVHAKSARQNPLIGRLLIDQVLPRVLAHGGAFVLHAALVRLGQTGIVLVGPSGAGKSTLSAALERHDCELLSDDCCVLRVDGGTVRAAPTYPSLRLWDDSAHQYAGHDARQRVSEIGKSKIRFARPVVWATQNLKVERIYVLAAPAKETVAATLLSPREACMSLVAASFQLNIADASQMASTLAVASAISNRLPSYELRHPRDFGRISEVCSFITATE